MALPSDPPEQLSPAGVRNAAFAGFCASLVGIGLARFAYSPLIPALITDHWFTETGAAYLGAANLAGYLAGALLGHSTTRRMPSAWVLRAMMLVTAASLFACEWRDGGFAWFFFWRLISGLTGGIIMVVAAPSVLVRTPPGRRGLVGGAIFTGVGIGIAASGTLIPFLLSNGGPRTAWLGLGALCLAFTLLSWTGWPDMPATAARAQTAREPKTRYGLPVLALLAVYGLNAVGLVPHMIFLVVYVARGLGRGIEAGAQYWVLFGLGAAVGPLLAGQFADRVGFRAAMRFVLATQILVVLTPAFLPGPLWLAVSSVIVGACTPGVVPLALGLVQALIEGHGAQSRVWGHATVAWAIGQGASAFGYTYLFGHTGSYALLFIVGSMVIAAALILDVAVGLGVSRRYRAR